MNSPAQEFPRPLPVGASTRLLPLSHARGACQSYALLHEPPAAAGGVPVVYLHGIQSHPAWFAASAAHLAACGHPVLQPVRRGSGANTASRGHADSATQLLADVDDAVAAACRIFDAPRIHLAGVSWGGKLAAAWALAPERAARLASLVLVAPGIAARVDVPAAVKLRIALCLLTSPRRPFDIPLNEPDLFTENPALQRWIADDPLRLRQASARFFFASRRLDSRLAHASAGRLALPVACLLASRDRIIDNDRTASILLRLTAGRARLIRIEGAHTLEFEPDPKPFLDALAASLVPAG